MRSPRSQNSREWGSRPLEARPLPNNFIGEISSTPELILFSSVDEVSSLHGQEDVSVYWASIATDDRAIIDVNSIVSGRNYDILTSIIAH